MRNGTHTTMSLQKGILYLILSFVLVIGGREWKRATSCLIVTFLQNFSGKVLKHKLIQDEATRLTMFVSHVTNDPRLISSFILFIFLFYLKEI